MARPRNSANAHLPRYMHFKNNAYYFYNGGPWIRLGKDHAEALVNYASHIGGSGDTLCIHELIDKAMPRVMLGRDKQGLSENTLENYRTAHWQLKEQCFEVNVPIKLLRAHHVLGPRDELRDHPGKFNNWLSVLRGIVIFAVERGLMITD